MNTSSSTPGKDAATQKKSLIPLMLALMLLLAVVNIVFYAYRSKPDERLLRQVSDQQTAMAELQENYQTAIQELEKAQQEKPELSAEIEALKQELTAEKKKIESGIQSDQDLEASRKQIAELIDEKNRYLAQIKGLEESLNKTAEDLQEALAANKDLLAAPGSKNTDPIITPPPPDKPVVEGPVITDKDVFNTLRAENINVKLLFLNRRNKERETRYADEAQRILFCFKLKSETPLPAKEIFCIRIVDPGGATLYSEDKGSGVQKMSKDNSSFRYTSAYITEPGDDKICGEWEQPNLRFMPGVYQLEVYFRGRLCGTTDFKMR